MSHAQSKLALQRWTRCRRILVIEEKGRLQALVSQLLPGERYQVVSGKPSESLCDPASETLRFDLVLIDLSNSRLGLFEPLARTRQRHPGAEVILICDPGQMDVWTDAIQRGAYECLPAPLEPEELKQVLLRAFRDRSRT